MTKITTDGHNKTQCCILFALIMLLPSGYIFSAHTNGMSLFDMPLEALMNVKISVASAFEEYEVDAGSSVSRIDSWQWEQRMSRNIFDALETVPNTVSLSSFLAGKDITIRGFARSTSTRGIATLLDGVPINSFIVGSAQTHSPYIDLGILDNIQMIRGPGSALYGADAFHGVLALNTFESRKNTSRILSNASHDGYYHSAAQVSSGLSSGWRCNIAAGINGQPDQDVAYDYTDPDDSIVKTGTRKWKHYAQTVAVKLNGPVEENTEYRLGLYCNAMHTDQFPGLGRSSSGQSSFKDRDWGISESDFFMAKLQRDQKLTPELTFGTVVWSWWLDRLIGLDTTRLPLGISKTRPASSELHRGIELNLKRRKQGATDVYVQLAHRHQEITDSTLDLFATDGSLLSSEIRPTEGAVRDTYSVATLFNTPILSDVHALYGGRIDYYSEIGSETTPRLGIIYNTTDKLTCKLLYGRAFRAPTAGESNNSINDLEPEIVDTFEAVSIHKSPSMTCALTLFYSKWQDGIILAPTLEGDILYQNIYKNSSRGAELSLNRVWSDFLLSSQLSYTESKNDSDDIDYVASPKVIFNLGISYRLPNHKTTLSLFSRSLFDMKSGPITDNVPDPEDIDDYWRVDARLSKEFGDRSELWLGVQNIFDRANATPSIFNAENGYQGLPVTANIGFNYTL